MHLFAGMARIAGSHRQICGNDLSIDLELGQNVATVREET